MTTRGLTLAALLAALGRPSWWLLALAGFLVRGGVLLFLLAIVSLPSPLIISNIVAPVIVPLALGRIDPGAIALLGGGAAIVAIWLVGGALVAATTEVALIRTARDAMLKEGLPVGPVAPPRRRLIGRGAASHLLAHVPTALVLAVGSVRIAGVAYIELTDPFDVTTPLIFRIAAGAAGSIAAIVVVWLLGELVGGLAARRIVLRGASVGGGLRGAFGDLVRRPAAALAPALWTTLVLVIDLAAGLGIVALAWTQLGERLTDSTTDLATTTFWILAFPASWIGALALTGLVDAWRSAAMTFEVERAGVAAASGADRAPDPGGTFGAPPGRRPGDWSTTDGGGSL
ncbi:MAG TPA: hypothetical protein VE640_05585 [Candidatus Bathyarchaeia archaeon]|nr:hypothetical protein [Candidatus Bathyarchaeia archaeon]